MGDWTHNIESFAAKTGSRGEISALRPSYRFGELGKALGEA